MTVSCAIKGCMKPAKTRGWCGMHYERWRQHGDPLFTLRPTWGMPAEERFWRQVNASGVCWEWAGGQRGEGYGTFDHKPVHRWAYEHLVGPIPAGMFIDHLCRNRLCVNPDHMEPVPNRVNILRGSAPPSVNARKTHCPKGHPYAGANLHIYIRPDTGKPMRTCRACHSKKARQATQGEAA